MIADRIGGIISILFGSVAISEAVRLYPYRTDYFAGDHVLPAVVGALLVLLGLLLAFAAVKGEKFVATFPDKSTVISMLLSFGLLFVYWVIIPVLGYVISTLLIAIGLFKVMGGFRLIKSALFGALLTSVFYMIFIYWLGMSFPKGMFY
ncbi:tripartite tricarboxylate transporter TctB family protein [Paenibacillus alkalitolerans]|uniref:tripartite tricarboxylate transporter TctB family protein n=1 Tax=Paenibacillus alkalitolerans TaxID=2799335 RepID=UPI0018F76D0E|nr:tripartite tricarboxylate transporter TctB family protein [Paenibacillus alkalitolerans]